MAEHCRVGGTRIGGTAVTQAFLHVQGIKCTHTIIDISAHARELI